MDKEEVLEAMGGIQTITAHPNRIPSLWGLLIYPSLMRSVTNPYRIENTRAPDGMRVELIYYYTDKKSDDNAITDDELTPIVLEDGEVVGWGWSFLEQNIERYKIELRIR